VAAFTTCVVTRITLLTTLMGYLVSIKMKKNLLSAALLIASFSTFSTEQPNPHWGYQGQESPEHWGELSPDFSLCHTGKNQSPINIHGALATQHSKLELTFRPGKQEVVNNGHTIMVNVSNGDTLHLDDSTFTLQQFHFHAPAENTIDGKHYPLEAHFVYKDKEGDLAVLALLFQQGKENPELDHAWRQMPVKSGLAVALDAPLDIKSLLPENRDVYRFSGSLTTPPCSEGVRWLVLKQIASASREQIDQFSSTMHHTNNRPVQPLNGRVIID
jgi:carbonic anhydrase